MALTVHDACAWMTCLVDQARGWVEAVEPDLPSLDVTCALSDLMFSWGLARLGEYDASPELLSQATRMLAGTSVPHDWLLKAFAHRIQQALDDQPHAGPLPAEFLEQREAWTDRMARYVVDRVRATSHILEPENRKPYPILGWLSTTEQQLRRLPTYTRAALRRRVRDLLLGPTPGVRGLEERTRIMTEALKLADREGEDYAREMFRQLDFLDELPRVPDTRAGQAVVAMLEQGLRTAIQIRAFDILPRLERAFDQFIQAQPRQRRIPVFQKCTDESFPRLIDLGLESIVQRRLEVLAERLLDGGSLVGVNFKTVPDGVTILSALLGVARNWLRMGCVEQAEPILRATRLLLFRGELGARQQTQVTCDYVKAYGCGCPGESQHRLEEVFQHVRGVRDQYTTRKFFGLAQMQVIEGIVLSGVEVSTRPLTPALCGQNV